MGRKIAADLEGGEVFALSGDLGSGKTTFVQGFAEGLGVTARIISPTFILVRKYETGDKNFYHVDLYRLEGDIENEVARLGINDIWKRPENVVIIEWAEKIKNIIPKDAKWIKFEDLGGDKRKIVME
ncbi:tRNA (adenosine(37)-N6)-threonylcarbamoyltransferase complex ATPase subunit type 1 TsaE [Candidatus Woesebacteria bacterium]|nr:tRNA (adenosine(37)-N6)-threonylcarbamoyltransferase complex ATPase subunit type 1 TsaE [Candidatus Woesebacteria bacterium]